MKHLKFFSFLLCALLNSSFSFAQIQADGYLTLDSCRSVTNTSAVHAGKAPLTQAYQGEGVIVGLRNCWAIVIANTKMSKPRATMMMRR